MGHATDAAQLYELFVQGLAERLTTVKIPGDLTGGVLFVLNLAGNPNPRYLEVAEGRVKGGRGFGQNPKAWVTVDPERVMSLFSKSPHTQTLEIRGDVQFVDALIACASTTPLNG